MTIRKMYRHACTALISSHYVPKPPGARQWGYNNKCHSLSFSSSPLLSSSWCFLHGPPRGLLAKWPIKKLTLSTKVTASLASVTPNMGVGGGGGCHWAVCSRARYIHCRGFIHVGVVFTNYINVVLFSRPCDGQGWLVVNKVGCNWKFLQSISLY